MRSPAPQVRWRWTPAVCLRWHGRGHSVLQIPPSGRPTARGGASRVVHAARRRVGEAAPNVTSGGPGILPGPPRCHGAGANQNAGVKCGSSSRHSGRHLAGSRAGLVHGPLPLPGERVRGAGAAPPPATVIRKPRQGTGGVVPCTARRSGSPPPGAGPVPDRSSMKHSKTLRGLEREGDFPAASVAPSSTTGTPPFDTEDVMHHPHSCG